MPKLINKRSDTLTKLDDNANDTEFGEEPYLNPVNKRLVERQMQLDWDKSTREDRYDAIMRLTKYKRYSGRYIEFFDYLGYLKKFMADI